MNRKRTIMFSSVIFAVLWIVLSLPIFSDTILFGDSTFYSPMQTGIILAILPLPIIILIYHFARGKQNRKLSVVLGVVCMAFFWMFTADPYTVEFRQSLGLPLSSIMIYTVIGIMFLALSVFLFRKGVED